MNAYCAKQWQPVVSSWVDRIILLGTDELAIRFRNGFCCRYVGTSAVDYRVMQAAASKGREVWYYLPYSHPYVPIADPSGTSMCLQIKDTAATKDFTDVRTLLFDETDGFSLSQPAAGQVRIDLSATSYSDEQAQDAVGNNMQDTATIDATYNDGAGTFSWDVKDDAISDAKLRNSAACSVIGRSANSTGDPADIAASTDGHYLRRDSSTVAFGAILQTHLPAPATSTPATLPGVPVWVEVSKTYSDLSAAATTNDIEIYSLPAGAVVHAVNLIHTTSFTGGGIFSYSISVGKTGNASWYTGQRFCDVAVNNSPTNYAATFPKDSVEDYGSAISIRLFAQATGANLNQATQGVVKAYLLISKAKP